VSIKKIQTTLCRQAESDARTTGGERMDQRQLIIFVAVALIVVGAVLGFVIRRQQRRKALRQRFGPEYDRVLQKEGNVRRAEGVLEWREKRREQFAIRPLSASARADFADRWKSVQSLFVDDPRRAITEADLLLNEVMHARGYPTVDFEQRAADLSVDHPVLVENYRRAHEIALRHGQGRAGTEDLRKALIHYRSLFDELLQPESEKREALG
jgi:hypothetical protein